MSDRHRLATPKKAKPEPVVETEPVRQELVEAIAREASDDEPIDDEPAFAILDKLQPLPVRDQPVRERILPFARALSPETNVTDANAFVAFLDAQKAVDKKRKIGTTGYCMGGPMVMRTAAAIPGRIGAGASFHGGGLATDKEDSQHLLIPQMKANFLIAIAENDDERDPEAKTILRKSFDDAGLAAEIEVYEGAMHGWCPPDSRVYNEEQAERACSRLLALFETALA